MAALPGLWMVIAVAEMVGSVTRERYDELVAQGRELVELASRAQFKLGDTALEIAPLHSGGKYADPGFQVEVSLAGYASDIGLSVRTLLTYRYVASRWPAAKRVAGVSHYIHKILASLDDEGERWSILLSPPRPAWSPSGRWTSDAAKRRVGQAVETPVTVQEKVEAIRDLARDNEVAAKVAGDILTRPEVAEATTAEEKIQAVAELTREPAVAARVATDLLRRPDVVAAANAAEKASVVSELVRDTPTAATVATSLLRRPEVADATMRDRTAKHQVNRAQVEHARRAAEPSRRAVAPALERLDHSLVFMEMLGSCAAFVTGIGRVMPRLSEHPLTGDERSVVHENIGKVKATCDWLGTAVDTGNTSMDEQLALLLRGE